MLSNVIRKKTSDANIPNFKGKLEVLGNTLSHLVVLLYFLSSILAIDHSRFMTLP